MVDLDAEIAKCENKIKLAEMNLSKIVKIESQPDYENSVPADIRMANEEKVRIAFLIMYSPC